MAFNPSSTIWLCTVPFDNTYKNVVDVTSVDEQKAYFEKRIVTTLSEYITVRKSLPDGGFQSSVKVNKNIDEIQTCNYMFYTNANHGIKYFYAFITNLIYVNEGTTEIVFETDVFHTWRFDITFLESYVVREHSATDKIGDNLVPEKFNFQDYEYRKASVYDENGNDYDPLKNWGYLVATTEQRGSDGSRGKMMSGIYQGLYFYYYHNENNLNNFLDEIEEEGGDCVVFIAVIPEFCLSNNTIGATDTDKENREGWIYYSDEPATTTVCVGYQPENYTFEGYKPKNKKLYTSPFNKLVVTNNNGEQAEYEAEYFDMDDPTELTLLKFKLYGDVSANPSVTLVPYFYRGVAEKYDSGISISGFPQCSFNSDTFKLWLAKNQYGVALDTLGNVGQIVTGIATAVATGGVGAVLGATQVVTGVQGVMGTVNNVYQASKEPNKTHGGSAKNNLLTAINKNKFEFYWQRIKRQHAETVDNFFTMYGYQTNKLKIPNFVDPLKSRPYFNYVQTVDINITGGIPCDDMQRLKAIFNSGVTLWNPHETMYDYSVNNSPV